MIKAFGEQLFRSGFIHGDPHPANGKSEGEVQGGGKSTGCGNSTGSGTKEGGKCKKKIARTGKKVKLYFALCRYIL